MNVRAGFVLLAGGMGSRMETGVNKVFLEVGGRSIIDFSLETASACDLVTEVVLVIRPDDVDRVHRLTLQRPDGRPPRIVFGGATRHASERAGVGALRADIEAGELDVVAVHDGARPFLSLDLLNRAIIQAATAGSAVPGRPVDNLLYLTDKEAFVDPGRYQWVQTPQVFAARTLLAAHDAAAEAGFEGVDTAEVVQAFSRQPIEIVAGDPANIKVTYQRDLSSAASLAEAWRAALDDHKAGRSRGDRSADG
ncbi:MAG: 2-C-methyl-D-erythritol 4-phosphate cytidylyltransferase [Acidimicrobiia bacterium]|nr:2-C-methyl-D-erythritol 4-phosphate cytidylyltransferase [Acidimicrobiia bacterium]